MSGWLNESLVEEELKKWFKRNLLVNPDLSYKFGPIQMPYNYNFYKSLCVQLFTSGQIMEFNTLLEQAVAVKDNWYGWYRTAEMYKDLGLWELSWKSLVKAINLSPRRNFLYEIMFVEVALNAKKFNEGEKLINNYINLKPISSHPYFCAGNFYLRFGNKKKAIEYFKEAVSKDKLISVNYSKLYISVAKLFTQEKMYEEAKRALDIILSSIDPFNKEAKSLYERL